MLIRKVFNLLPQLATHKPICITYKDSYNRKNN